MRTHVRFRRRTFISNSLELIIFLVRVLQDLYRDAAVSGQERPRKRDKTMKTKWLAVLTALHLVFGLAVRTNHADDGSSSGSDVQSGKGDKPPTPTVPQTPDQPTLPPPADTGGDLPGPTPDNSGHQRPDRPDKPDNHGGGSAAMKELVKEFQTKITDLHNQRQDLVKQLKDATEDQRAAIREQLQANRDAINQAKEEFRDAVKELHVTLKNQTAKVDAELKAELKANAKGGRARE